MKIETGIIRFYLAPSSQVRLLLLSCLTQRFLIKYSFFANSKLLYSSIVVLAGLLYSSLALQSLQYPMKSRGFFYSHFKHAQHV